MPKCNTLIERIYRSDGLLPDSEVLMMVGGRMENKQYSHQPPFELVRSQWGAFPVHENIEGIPKAKEWMLRHDVNICKPVSEVTFILFWFVGDAIDRKPLGFL